MPLARGDSMNRTTLLQDRRMQKLRTALSRWEPHLGRGRNASSIAALTRATADTAFESKWCFLTFAVGAQELGGKIGIPGSQCLRNCGGTPSRPNAVVSFARISYKLETFSALRGTTISLTYRRSSP